MYASLRTIWIMAALSVPGLAQDPGNPPESREPAPRAKIGAETKAALAAAKELASKVKGTAGADRLQALEAAAQAYEDVASRFTADAVGCAAALFQAGEMWRRHGSLAPAERAYLDAAGRDPARYGQRATLQAADMQRRQKRVDEALATYRKAESLAAETSRAQEARLWQARLLQGLGKLDEAVTGFRGAVEAAKRPRQVIAACNWLAKALIDKGDLKGAEAALAHAAQAVTAAGAEGIEAERLQKALDGMSARRALQRARDRVNGAGKDARQLEKDRGK